ncbi:MAG: hypothetical protein ABIN91_00490 [Mucilaginibacter sp.]
MSTTKSAKAFILNFYEIKIEMVKTYKLLGGAVFADMGAMPKSRGHHSFSGTCQSDDVNTDNIRLF